MNHFYQAIPDTYNTPIFDKTPRGYIRLIGAALAKREGFVTIAMHYGRFLLNTKDAYYEETIYLNLAEDAEQRKYIEFDRYLLIPPIPEDDQYRLIFDSKYIEDIGRHALREAFFQGITPSTRETEMFSQERREEDKQLLQKDLALHFEIARLFVYLPSYFEFMYDIVVEEKRPIKGKHTKRIKDTKKKKKTNWPLYKIIRSVRINYAAEEETRIRNNIPRKTYTPPAYKYAVCGHWRILAQTWWKGKDPHGKEVLGKTWVSEYVKGEGKKLFDYEIFEQESSIVIKLKEPLKYGKEKVIAYEQERQCIDKEYVNKSEQKPSIRWMYEERKKLTAGLRYIILERDSFKCVKCGARGTDQNIRLEVDHIVPISEWGKTEESNLSTICQHCNRGKGAKLSWTMKE